MIPLSVSLWLSHVHPLPVDFALSHVEDLEGEMSEVSSTVQSVSELCPFGSSVTQSMSQSSPVSACVAVTSPSINKLVSMSECFHLSSMSLSARRLLLLRPTREAVFWGPVCGEYHLGLCPLTCSLTSLRRKFTLVQPSQGQACREKEEVRW